jgi:hypothetical protein
MDERSKAEAVLELMHKQFLQRYMPFQTRFDVLLATGQYNCVSSAVLYTILGTAVGLNVKGVRTSDHAFCSVKIGSEHIDIETTSIYGFDPGSKKNFHDAFGKLTGFAYVPPGNYRDRTLIDRKILFSLILANRIAESERSKQYADAVTLSVDLWAFLGNDSETASTDARGEMIRYGTQLVKSGREEQALDWADAVIKKYGPNPKWNDFVLYAASTLVANLLRRGQTANARMRFETLRTRLDEKTAKNLNAALSDAELVDALNTGKKTGNEADFLGTLKKVRLAGVVPAKRIRDIEVSWQLYKIERIAQSEGWAAAYTATEQAIAETGSDIRLENALKTCRANHITDLYNTVVTAYNNKQYGKAQSLAESALSSFPDEGVFRSLLADIERAVKSNK